MLVTMTCQKSQIQVCKTIFHRCITRVYSDFVRVVSQNFPFICQTKIAYVLEQLDNNLNFIAYIVKLVLCLNSLILKRIRSYRCVSMSNIPVNAIAPRKLRNDVMLSNTGFYIITSQYGQKSVKQIK
jgi:hypothetical protein